MTNEEAISVIENEIQIDVRLCTDEQADRFQTALYMAISALRAEPTGDSLTLEQLREMDRQPAWCEERNEWGIIHVDPDGPWANVPFFRGVYCDLDVQHNGLTLYAYQPAHIDREVRDDCLVCGKYKLMSFNAWKDEYSMNRGPEAGGGVKFCPHCGKPRTPAVWAELEKRMGG